MPRRGPPRPRLDMHFAAAGHLLSGTLMQHYPYTADQADQQRDQGCARARMCTGAVPATKARLWDATIQTIRQRHGPAAFARVSTVTPAVLLDVAHTVGDAFFYRGFVSFIQRRLLWVLVLNPNRSGGTGAANTGYNHPLVRPNRTRAQMQPRVVTTLEAHVMDAALDQMRADGLALYNDGFLVADALEWMAHVIGHELLHVFHMHVCGWAGNGHPPEFLRLNQIILGGHGAGPRLRPAPRPASIHLVPGGPVACAVRCEHQPPGR